MTRQYRAARLFPLELAHNVEIYFEEELYAHSLSLLLSILASSTAGSDPTQTPATVPLPSYLALAATLSVHPLTTTRTKTVFTERHEASLLALKLLKQTLAIAGPTNGGFYKAFDFKHFEGGLTRHCRGHRKLSGTGLVTLNGERIGAGTPGYDFTSGDNNQKSDDHSQLDSVGQMRNEFAGNSSLWIRAEDFWACVGWAFNCSVIRFKLGPDNIYEKRWDRWQVWLEFMLDLLEEDWKLREIKPEDDDSDNIASQDGYTSDATKQRLQGSLIYKYVVTASGDYGRDRRIVRAIFADGSGKSINEFREVFKNELKEPKTENEKDVRAALEEAESRVNVEENKYGDYVDGPGDNDDSEEEDEAPKTRRSGRPKRRKAAREDDPHDSSLDSETLTLKTPDIDAGASLGSTSSITLRLRLMSLLFSMSISLSSPTQSATWTPQTILETSALNDLFTEFTKYLPLSTFSLLLSPTLAIPVFELNYYTTLCENLLFRLLESSAPETDKMYLTQRKLQHCFLPYAANGTGAIENAKVSLVLEGLMRAMFTEQQSGDGEDYLKYRDELNTAVEEGIARREGKVKRKAGKKDGEDDMAWTMLQDSGERIRDVVQRLKTER